MTYHWPTRDGWLMVAFLLGLAAMAGGSRGLGIMAIFLVCLSLFGNLLLP